MLLEQRQRLLNEHGEEAALRRSLITEKDRPINWEPLEVRNEYWSPSPMGVDWFEDSTVTQLIGYVWVDRFLAEAGPAFRQEVFDSGKRSFRYLWHTAYDAAHSLLMEIAHEQELMTTQNLCRSIMRGPLHGEIMRFVQFLGNELPVALSSDLWPVAYLAHRLLLESPFSMPVVLEVTLTPTGIIVQSTI